MSYLEFRVDKDKLIYIYDRYSKEDDSMNVETELEIKDDEQLEEFIKFKNYMYLLNNSEEYVKVFISDKENKMFQSDEEKYKELYGE